MLGESEVAGEDAECIGLYPYGVKGAVVCVAEDDRYVQVAHHTGIPVTLCIDNTAHLHLLSGTIDGTVGEYGGAALLAQ